MLTVHDRGNWVTIQDLAAMGLAEADIPIALTLQQHLSRTDTSGDYYDLHFQEYSHSPLHLE